MIILSQPLSCFLFSFSSNLPNHDNAFCLWVLDELSQNINKISAVEGITSYSYYCTLT
jgi:hypothetical protein